MMRRTNILWGALLGCSLLCLGMRPRPLTTESIPQRSRVKIQAQPWKSRLFYRIQRDSTGQYALRTYQDLNKYPSYRLRGNRLLTQEDEYVILGSEVVGPSRVFTVYNKADTTRQPKRIIFSSRDSLGVIWDVNGERYVDSLHLSKVYVKRYVLPHQYELRD